MGNEDFPASQQTSFIPRRLQIMPVNRFFGYRIRLVPSISNILLDFRVGSQLKELNRKYPK